MGRTQTSKHQAPTSIKASNSNLRANLLLTVVCHNDNHLSYMATLASTTALGSLLTEVSALANRLKGAATVDPRHGSLAPGTRMVARLLRDDGPQTVPRIARV